MTEIAIDNERVASTLERIANLLDAQGANLFRVAAYRTAAIAARSASAPLSKIVEREGLAGLERIPGVGPGIASAIRELVRTGRLGLLERLEGLVAPEDLFTTIPGIGSALARRIHTRLDIDTLEDLEVAAHDGRLERLPGIGPRRAQAVRDLLAARLSQSVRRRARRLERGPAEPDVPHPSVGLLLDVDREYREGAASGELPRIAPRRFNPKREAWLPILHTSRETWNVTALYSNSSAAHRLRRTNDWVILYYESAGHEDQCTVVTETRGVLAGRRVVRGREQECRAHYAGTDGESRAPRAS